jgi:hypothetical protein
MTLLCTFTHQPSPVNNLEDASIYNRKNVSDAPISETGGEGEKIVGKKPKRSSDREAVHQLAKSIH